MQDKSVRRHKQVGGPSGRTIPNPSQPTILQTHAQISRLRWTRKTKKWKKTHRSTSKPRRDASQERKRTAYTLVCQAKVKEPERKEKWRIKKRNEKERLSKELADRKEGKTTQPKTSGLGWTKWRRKKKQKKKREDPMKHLQASETRDAPKEERPPTLACQAWVRRWRGEKEKPTNKQMEQTSSQKRVDPAGQHTAKMHKSLPTTLNTSSRKLVNDTLT